MSSIHFCTGGRALSVAVGITMLVLLLAGGAGAENSYEFVWGIPSQPWFFDGQRGIAVDSV
jgi:hypothetical protein